MQDRTIDNALLALRKQIIRGNLKGQSQVETLLRIRGAAFHSVYGKPQNPARQGFMTWLVLEALRDGPKRVTGVAAHVATKRPDISPDAAYKRTGQVLSKLKVKGLVRREGRVWRVVGD